MRKKQLLGLRKEKEYRLRGEEPRRRKERARSWAWHIEPETKRGIGIIVLVVLGLLALFSLSGVAGGFGQFVDRILGVFFGWTRWLFPFLLFIFAYLLLHPERYTVKGFNLFGLFLFLVSFLGLVHLSVDERFFVPAALHGEGGGYLGLLLSYPLTTIMGFWATLVLLVALLLISILIVFNTSLERLLEEGNATRRFLHAIRRFLFDWKYEEQHNEPESPIVWKREEIHSPYEEQQLLPVIHEETAPVVAPRAPRRHPDLSLDLLNGEVGKPTSGDIEANKEIIRKTFEHFGITVEMGMVAIGPTVTQYTLKPAEGVKVSQIVALHNDLALALAAHPIRIEAPIPGKSLIGLEVPNQKVAIVPLREVLSSEEFTRRTSNLMIALGKDVSGKPWLANLQTMPHLLVAGATGSGKSVALNAILVSLLYENGPDDLKLLLVDPKRVELTIYNDIPHLLTPVITEVSKTVNALRWALSEMDRRFHVLSEAKKRDIQGYNAGREDKMPFIVIVIDELADLMVSAASEVEGSIIRLAQMARAVGMHLVVATQRPSVDVITGLIKANITSRIAFSVASQTDSRTILDSSGAEKLLGRGDMLFISAELSKPKRLQGAYVREEEIQRVVQVLREKGGAPSYDASVTDRQSSSGLQGGIPGLQDGGDDDPLIPDAKRVLREAGKGSASLLQRRLKVGYARAARLLDILEEQGFIGPAEGAKPRELLMIDEEYGMVEEASLSSTDEDSSSLPEKEEPPLS